MGISRFEKKQYGDGMTTTNLKVVIKHHSVGLLTVFKKNLVGYSNTLWQEDIITEATKEIVLDPSREAVNRASELVSDISRTFGATIDLTKQTLLMKNLVKVLEREGEVELVSRMREELLSSFNISFQLFYGPISDVDANHQLNPIAYSEPADAYYGPEADSYFYTSTVESDTMFEMESFDDKQRFVGLPNRPSGGSHMYKQMVLPQMHSNSHYVKNSDPVIGTHSRHRRTTHPSVKPPAVHHRLDKQRSSIPTMGTSRPMQLSGISRIPSFSPKRTPDTETIHREQSSSQLSTEDVEPLQYISVPTIDSSRTLNEKDRNLQNIGTMASMSSSSGRVGLEKEELEQHIMSLKEWIKNILHTQTTQMNEKLNEIVIKKEELLLKSFASKEKALELQKSEHDKYKQIEMKLITEQKEHLFEKERRIEQHLYMSVTLIIALVAIAFVMFSFWFK